MIALHEQKYLLVSLVFPIFYIKLREKRVKILQITGKKLQPPNELRSNCLLDKIFNFQQIKSFFCTIMLQSIEIIYVKNYQALSQKE